MGCFSCCQADPFTAPEQSNGNAENSSPDLDNEEDDDENLEDSPETINVTLRSVDSIAVVSTNVVQT